MSVERVRAHLKKFGADGRILNRSGATVELAAEALGCEPCRIAKTLSFSLGDKVILVVAAAVLGILFSLLKWHRSGKEAGK